MIRRFVFFCALTAPVLIGGCQSSGPNSSLGKQLLSTEQMASLAVGMNYQAALRTLTPRGKTNPNNFGSTAAPELTTGSVEAPSDIPEAPIGNSFGPRIGQYFLADDYVVYRHAKPQSDLLIRTSQSGNGAPADQISADSANTVRVDLTYFLVSTTGKIEDYAVGQLDTDGTSCIQIIARQSTICNEPELLSQDFERFDQVMRISIGAPLSEWNLSANAAAVQSTDLQSVEAEPAIPVPQ